MYTLDNLKVSEVRPIRGGLLVYAKYVNSFYEYAFFIHHDGRVKRRTVSGFWEDISPETARIIHGKIRKRTITGLA
ncbi:MAG: hypothetical protein JXD21_08445 [Candidatus Omnitrophica bacterium]|nr:hypothetical protein [Candidatus Omnitrophota bacterium]